jgi:hypothetical protein
LGKIKDSVICRYCKESLLKIDAELVGKTNYFHPDCLKQKKADEDAIEAEKLTKKALKEEEKAAKEAARLEAKEGTVNEYSDLIAYICNLYKIKAPTGMILKQVKDFQVDYGYKLSGIKLSLQYFFETKGNEVLEDSGIGIVPFVYEEAKKHFIMKREVERSIEDYVVSEVEEVFVDLQIKSKTRRNFIDISLL